MNSVTNVSYDVKSEFDTPKTQKRRKSNPSNKLELCSGAKVKQQQPPTSVLEIGKNISLVLTLEQQTRKTVRRIGGAG